MIKYIIINILSTLKNSHCQTFTNNNIRMAESIIMKVLSFPHILALSSKSESFICQTFTDNNIRMAEQEREASIRLRGLIGR